MHLACVPHSSPQVTTEPYLKHKHIRLCTSAHLTHVSLRLQTGREWSSASEQTGNPGKAGKTDLCVSRPSERQIVCSFTSKAHSCEGGVERSMCTCWQIRKAAKNKPSTAKSLLYLTAAGTNTCIFVLFLVQQERKQDERRMKVEQRLRKCHRNQPFLFSSNTYNMLQEGKCGCLWAAGMRLLHTFKSTLALQM